MARHLMPAWAWPCCHAEQPNRFCNQIPNTCGYGQAGRYESCVSQNDRPSTGTRHASALEMQKVSRTMTAKLLLHISNRHECECISRLLSQDTVLQNLTPHDVCIMTLSQPQRNPLFPLSILPLTSSTIDANISSMNC